MWQNIKYPQIIALSIWRILHTTSTIFWSNGMFYFYQVIFGSWGNIATFSQPPWPRQDLCFDIYWHHWKRQNLVIIGFAFIPLFTISINLRQPESQSYSDIMY
jgi:hypothetical protein